MKKIIFIPLIIFLFLFKNLYSSNLPKCTVSTSELYELCQNSSGMCYGYIGGVFDKVISENSVDFVMNKMKETNEDFKLCKQDRVYNLEQIGDVVFQWLVQNPKLRHGCASQDIESIIKSWLECGTPALQKLLKEKGY